MSNEWVEMLKSYDIEPADSDAAIMARAREVTSNVPQIIDLSGFSIIEVTGEEAQSFLQGQFCNDLQQVTASRAQITGYCTPKGRLLALPTVVGFESGFRLLVPHSVKEAFIKRLSMFVMRAKVTIREVSDRRCFGIIATDESADSLVETLVSAVPAASLDVITDQTTQVVRWHDDAVAERRARFLVIADSTLVEKFWNQEGELVRAGHGAWRLADICAGVPSITGGVVEAFVPQMMNLQLIDALSFTKGCYPGQEIVARMQYLGKIKRHMRLFCLPLHTTSTANAEHFSSSGPAAGSKLSCGTDQEAGVVVDAAQLGDSAIYVLAVVKVSANGSTLQYDGHDLLVKELPYELPSLNSPEPEID